METIQTIWNFITAEVQPHWPAIMYIIVITVIAQTIKTRVLTKKIATKNKSIFWARRIFPLIILLIGLIVGFIWPGEASPGVVETTHKILYFMGCSALSIVGFNIVKQWIKKKYDIEIEISELEQ